jgi:hypothetical protein
MYLFCAAAEDENVQKKGIVCVWMNMGPKCIGLVGDKAFALKKALFISVFPVRVDATHICSDKSGMPADFARIFTQLWSTMSRSIRVRSRYYTGTCNIVSES